MDNKILLNQFIKSIAKSIPFIGGGLEEITFGTLKEIDEKKLQEEFKKYRENVTKNLSEISEIQNINLVLFLSLINFQRKFLSKLDLLEEKITDINFKNTPKLINRELNSFKASTEDEFNSILLEQENIEKYNSDVTTYFENSKSKLEKSKNINSWFIHPDYACNRHTKKSIKLITHINKIIRNKNTKLIAILGEYGTGKTTLSKKIEYDLLKSNESNVFYFSLKKLYNNSNTNFIRNFLSQNNISNGSFQDTIKKRKTIFILDGFDEISPIVKESINVLTISDLLNYLPENAKIILTSRSTYFETKKQELNSISKINGILNNYTGLSNKNNTSIIYLNNFSEDKLILYTKKRIKSKYKTFLNEVFNKNYFKEISKRPIIADLVCSEWQYFATNELKNVFDIYDGIINSWIDREAWRINNKTKILDIIESISIDMFENNKITVSSDKLDIEIQRQAPELDISVLKSNLRTCTFFSRDDFDNYEFMHKSFWEYFVSKMLIKQLKEKIIDSKLKLWEIIEFGLIFDFLKTQINKKFLWDYIMSFQPARTFEELTNSTNLFILYFDMKYYSKNDNLKGCYFWIHLMGRLNIHNTTLNEPIYIVP